MNQGRKTLTVQESIHQALSDYLQEVQSKQGIKISINSWVSQAIREKIERDTNPNGESK